MNRYAIEQRVLVDANLLEDDLVSQVEAAKMLGITVQAVSQLLSRGKLTVVVDKEAPNLWRGRRLVLRSEIEGRVG